MLFGREFGIWYLVSQVFALLATILGLYAFQKRRKVQILNFTVVASMASVAHYLCLGAWAGAASKSISLARNAFGAYEAHLGKVSKIAPIFFALLYAVFGILAYESPLSLLPILAPVIYTFGIYLADARHLRYTAITASIIWVIYNISVFSIVGVIAETLTIINLMIAIFRYRTKAKRRRSTNRGKKQK